MAPVKKYVGQMISKRFRFPKVVFHPEAGVHQWVTLLQGTGFEPDCFQTIG